MNPNEQYSARLIDGPAKDTIVLRPTTSGGAPQHQIEVEHEGETYIYVATGGASGANGQMSYSYTAADASVQ